MASVDAHALERETLEDILRRVGAVLARSAIELLGGTYGRRVVAVAGSGLNGQDARRAVRSLRARGVVAEVIDVAEMHSTFASAAFERADLILDGGVGTGLNRPWQPPPVDARVLAIDVPSGIDPLTGVAVGAPWRAARTVTLQTPKPGLYLADGPDFVGEIVVEDIGLTIDGVVASPTCHLVESSDVATWLPVRPRTAHKYASAVLVVAGSPGMTGAAALCCAAALRAGAGYVHLDSAAERVPGLPIEVVSSLAGRGTTPDASRFGAAVIGPGLGRSPGARELVQAVAARVESPIVIDGDGLAAIAGTTDVTERKAATVLTPHDGEFARLADAVGLEVDLWSGDRIDATRRLAHAYQATVVAKGPSTIVADPGGEVFLSTAGTEALATAGSGDVLAGVIAAFLAAGVDPMRAATAGAWVHGESGRGRGLVASDLPDRVAEVIANIQADAKTGGWRPRLT